MKIAIVHYWLVNYRGGEKVIENLLELYPNADLFTLFWEPSKMPEAFQNRVKATSFLNRFKIFRNNHRLSLPLMPLALEQLDLRGYDLVISSESGPAKGVITDPNALHICYCHSPMRYIWDMYHDYKSNMGYLSKLIFTPLAHYLRIWDRSTANGVDHFIANSNFIAKRILSCYRRKSDVIFPPVNIKKFKFEKPIKKANYFFTLAELVPYKRIDLAVKAFNANGLNLKIAGQGPELEKLKSMAKSNIEFLGRVNDKDLPELYAKAKAFIFPGKEDFGITPLEANACGTAVIAYNAGGILDTQTQKTAILFNNQNVDDLIKAIEIFKPENFTLENLTNNAKQFSNEVFKNNIALFIKKHLQNLHK